VSVATPASTPCTSVVPRLVKFSGIVKDSAGRAHSGTFDLTFALYELQEGGNPLWVETQSVQADEQGRYTVLLGAASGDRLPLDLFANRKARWLGVQSQLVGLLKVATARHSAARGPDGSRARSRTQA